MSAEIGIAAALFAFTVVFLSLVVLAARLWLAPQHPAEVKINEVSQTLMLGQNLLRSLATKEIYLPSPCGGKGMCGQCKLTFAVDAPPVLPTEIGQLSRREISQGTRLACAHKVAEGMSLRLPDALLSAASYTCTVHATHNVATYLREVVLDIDPSENFSFQAGQYVMVEAPVYDLSFSSIQLAPEYRRAWEEAGILALHSSNNVPTARAYSLANAPNEKRLALVVRIATPPPTAQTGTPPGIVSSYVFGLKPGDTLKISGPYGDFHAHASNREMMLIAGGAGIAPIRSIIHDQLINQSNTRPIVFWYGARALDDLCYTAEFDGLANRYENFSWHVALSAPDPNDDWQGNTGFVHDVVYEKQLKDHPAPELIEYYLCGPPVMSVAVIQMLEDVGVDHESIFLDNFGT